MKRNFYCNALGLGGLIFCSLISWTTIALVLFGMPKDVNPEKLILFVVIIILLLCGGLFLLLFGIFYCAARISFDERGIHKSVLGFFLKKDISWDELKVIRLYPTNNVVCWIAFSKLDITKLDYNKNPARKETIHLLFNKKIYKCIRECTDIEIIGYDKDKNY